MTSKGPFQHKPFYDSTIPSKMGGKTALVNCKISVAQLSIRTSARENTTSVRTKGRDK